MLTTRSGVEDFVAQAAQQVGPAGQQMRAGARRRGYRFLQMSLPAYRKTGASWLTPASFRPAARRFCDGVMGAAVARSRSRVERVGYGRGRRNGGRLAEPLGAGGVALVIVRVDGHHGEIRRARPWRSEFCSRANWRWPFCRSAHPSRAAPSGRSRYPWSARRTPGCGR